MVRCKNILRCRFLVFRFQNFYMDFNTTNQIETTGPVAAVERIKTIDIVRGVALLGLPKII